jgi:uncharacterized Tic20 family protein
MAEKDANKEERMWALFTHLSALAGLTAIPLAHILGPLIIWLIKREEMPLVDRNGKEAMNFQISMTIYALVTIPLMFVIIGIPLFLALVVADIVFVIMASIKTNEGKEFHYPLAIPFFKNE